MSYINIDDVDFKDGIRDAFGRVRVSQPITIFEHLSRYTALSAYNDFDSLTANGGSILFKENESCIDLKVPTTSGARAVKQTYRYFPYQPGKSKLVFLTGVLDISGGDVNRVCKIGVFDDERDKTVDTGGDGFFFALSGTTLVVGKRSSVTGTQIDTIIPQSEWNVDPMNGLGNSRVNINVSKTQIFFFDQEWLGVGSVRMGFVIDGVLYYCHKFHHANNIDEVYTRSASLPIRYEIENSDTCSKGGILKQICSTIISEGGFSPQGDIRSANTGTTASVVSATDSPIIGIRVNPSYNRTSLTLKSIDLKLDSNQSILVQLIVNPTTVTGASWVSVNNSLVQYDTSATSLSGGTVLYTGYLRDKGDSLNIADIANYIWASSNIKGISIPFYIIARSFSSTANTYCAVTWQEIT